MGEKKQRFGRWIAMAMDKNTEDKERYKIITSLPNGKEKKLTYSLEKVKAIADGKMTLKDIKINCTFVL